MESHDLEDEVTSLKLTILGLTDKHEQADVSLQGDISEDGDSSNDISVMSDNSERDQEKPAT